MQKKPIFTQIIILVVIALVCILLTVALAILFGSVDTTLFDLRNLNIANMIPVILIGGFLTCVIVGITVLFVSKNSFFKIREYLFETKNEGEDEK